MTNLLERIKTRRRDAADAEREAQRALWTEYRELLARRDTPKKGDDQRLEELLQRLGLDLADAELHARVIERHDQAKAAFDVGNQHEQHERRLGAKIDDLNRQLDALRRQVEPLAAERREAAAAVTAARANREAIDVLVRTWPALLGAGDDRGPTLHDEQRPEHNYASALIDQVRRDVESTEQPAPPAPVTEPPAPTTMTEVVRRVYGIPITRDGLSLAALRRIVEVLVQDGYGIENVLAEDRDPDLDERVQDLVDAEFARQREEREGVEPETCAEVLERAYHLEANGFTAEEAGELVAVVERLGLGVKDILKRDRRVEEAFGRAKARVRERQAAEPVEPDREAEKIKADVDAAERGEPAEAPA